MVSRTSDGRQERRGAGRDRELRGRWRARRAAADAAVLDDYGGIPRIGQAAPEANRPEAGIRTATSRAVCLTKLKMRGPGGRPVSQQRDIIVDLFRPRQNCPAVRGSRKMTTPGDLI